MKGLILIIVAFFAAICCLVSACTTEHTAVVTPHVTVIDKQVCVLSDGSSLTITQILVTDEISLTQGVATVTLSNGETFTVAGSNIVIPANCVEVP